MSKRPRARSLKASCSPRSTGVTCTGQRHARCSPHLQRPPAPQVHLNSLPSAFAACADSEHAPRTACATSSASARAAASSCLGAALGTTTRPSRANAFATPSSAALPQESSAAPFSTYSPPRSEPRLLSPIPSPAKLLPWRCFCVSSDAVVSGEHAVAGSEVACTSRASISQENQPRRQGAWHRVAGGGTRRDTRRRLVRCLSDMRCFCSVSLSCACARDHRPKRHGKKNEGVSSASPEARAVYYTAHSSLRARGMPSRRGAWRQPRWQPRCRHCAPCALQCPCTRPARPPCPAAPPGARASPSEAAAR